MSTALSLAPRLDLSAAKDLHAAVLARRGGDLQLDAGQVTHLGALGLQLLLAAKQSWQRDGHRLAISPRSQAFDDALRLFGVAPDDLVVERRA
ncbi:STAS domain-containing protein [Phaeovulum sp.]|uniref:STAS domain-containing protein n=1 Tax=Phaeovulum sp. TaxID=2934796 RepID=UPI00356208B6